MGGIRYGQTQYPELAFFDKPEYIQLSEMMDWREFWTNIEFGNKYDLTHEGERFGCAVELKKADLVANLLTKSAGPDRGFSATILDKDKKAVLSFNRDVPPLLQMFPQARLCFPKLDDNKTMVRMQRGGQSVIVGRIAEKFYPLTTRTALIYDANDNLLFGMQAEAGFAHTYNIYANNVSSPDMLVAQIVKKNSNVMTELLTDKDKFRIVFNYPNLLPEHKALLVVMAFIIDVKYFGMNHWWN